MLIKFFKQGSLWVEEYGLGKYGKLLILLGFSILLANCATSRSETDSSAGGGINPVPVPIYNPVIANPPGSYTPAPDYSTSQPKYSPPKASKKKKKKPVAKKSKSSKKKKVTAKKRKTVAKKVTARKTTKKKTAVKRAVASSGRSTGIVSQRARQIAEDSSSLDNLKVMGQYGLGDNLSLTVTPLSQGQVSVAISGSHPSGQPCNFSGVGHLRNGSATVTDKDKNALDFSFSDKAVKVQGGTLGQSCGGDYSQK